MRSSGFSAEIHKVADTDKRLALFIGMAFLFVWVVTVNKAVQELTPRWFQRQFEWLASDQIPPIFLTMAFASLIAAALLWALSGNGDKLFDINEIGIKSEGWLGGHQYHWADFELLERQVSTIILHLAPSIHGPYGRKKISFDISAMDCSGARLESLIVYYRPDLYSTQHVARQDSAKMLNAGLAEPAEPPQPKPNALTQRMARMR